MDKRLIVFGLMHGADVRQMDADIVALEGEPASEELRERLNKAQAALPHKADVLRHLEWIDSRLREIRREGYLLPLAGTGLRVTDGHKSRDDCGDKQDFMALVKRLHATMATPPASLADWKAIPEIKPFARKWTGRDTLRNWLSEALPGVLKPGRPRKHTVIR